ncbi:proliferating cell nuclear antigen-like isoform X2 [Durio zibethinus]|uniref:DNA sliding clamp PCNA n=1 Tax=Durio zibethinus TaxID=66656 RepID=A0A6P6AJM1_DURZI|nr:proliferating cell nuclear antigen-like isoform X2 [Durio zibethinus]
MLELRLTQAGLLKKVLESIKDLVTDANFDCSATGFSLQAMDSSHVALVALLLRSDGFEHYRCDHNISMGMNLGNMAKMLRCASDDDTVTIKADDGSDTVTFMFESPSQDKISDYEMKLMDIDSEHLGIPEAEYQAIVRMSASEFARICKDLGTIGDTVIISVTKEGVQFSTKGDIGTANIICRKNTAVDKKEEATVIEMAEPVSLTFASRYLIAFTKATPLAGQVTISMSYDMPIVVEYKMETMGYMRFYLAPKIEEDEGTGPQEENVPKVGTKTKADVNPKVERKPKKIKSKEVIEIEEGNELEVEPKTKLEKIESDDESEPKVESKPEIDIKPKEEIEMDETNPQVEAKAEVETMDVE